MSRKFNTIADINDPRKETWKLAVRVTGLWDVCYPPKLEFLEMILMDAKGDKIEALVKSCDLKEFKQKLKEDNTYVLQNFEVHINDGHYIKCDHPFKLFFNMGTRVREQDLPEIRRDFYLFKKLGDILSGKLCFDLLIDVIGVFYELLHSESDIQKKKVVISMKDHSGNILNCTLWEEYASKFLSFHQSHKSGAGPMVIIVTLAKIKEAKGNYPISIANTKCSKLLINENIVEIQEFKNSLDPNQVHESYSQRLSQMSPCSQVSSQDRYRLEIQVYHKRDTANFVMWDRDCSELIGQSALDLRNLMITEGEPDPMAFPECIDDIVGITLAFRIKVQPSYNRSSVLMVSKDAQFIESILNQIPPDEETCILDKEKSVSFRLKEDKEDALYDTVSLYLGGRTAHSKFVIPVPTLENSTCNIHQGSELAELLKQTKLIIWDEALMTHKFCFKALDKSLRDIMSFRGNASSPFGGKVIIFGGDFRKILPVIPRGSRYEIVNATINSSYLWENFQVLTLTKNMRLQHGPHNNNASKLREFSQWILDVGDGKLSEPNDGYASIEIPHSFLITDFDDPIDAIVRSTYLNIVDQYLNDDFLQSRAILASTIETVDQINDYVLSLIPGLPNHKIKLKVGSPIMLLRNLDQSERLCNGTRLIVTRLANHVIEAKIMTGKNIGNVFCIPRMSMSPSQSPWPFKLTRRQFPLIVSYAMTINKSQGQSLASVGLYLLRPVFNHGQLYVALSIVQSKQGLKILIHDKEGKVTNTTTNVVFKEVFQNL